MPLRPRLRALSCPPAQRTGLAGDCQKLTALPFPQSPSLNSWDSIPDVLGSSPLTSSFWKQQQAPTLSISSCSLGQAPNSFLLPASLSPLEPPIVFSHSVLAQNKQSQLTVPGPNTNGKPWSSPHTSCPAHRGQPYKQSPPPQREVVCPQPLLASPTLSGVASLPPWALTRRSSGRR